MNAAPERHPQKIRQMFGAIASRYDFFNHFFSFGFDRLWRRCLIQEVLRHQPRLVLDLATGSGDVVQDIAQNGVEVVGADFCYPMLQQARQKGLSCLVAADALQLPFADETFDAVTIAFGFRNFEDRIRGLAEIRRVLKTSGRLYILEFSKPHFLLKPFYLFYLRHLMPFVTDILTRQRGAYAYLASSIQDFPDQQKLCVMLQESLFTNVSYKNLSFGIVALHSMQK